MNQDVRKLPKKTIIIITLMSLIAIAGYIFLQNMKELRMTEIIATLGHKNINDMEVINKLSVEDKETRYKSKVFKVRFFDKDLDKTCIGFIHIGKNRSYSKDIDCK